MCMDGWQTVATHHTTSWKWLNFEELYKISHFEIDIHILNLNPLGHDCFQGKIKKADYNKTSAQAIT